MKTDRLHFPPTTLIYAVSLIIFMAISAWMLRADRAADLERCVTMLDRACKSAQTDNAACVAAVQACENP